MTHDKLNARVLRQLAATAKEERTENFNSPGTVGRRKPRLVLTGTHADAVGRARYGDKISLRVHGTVTERNTPGQRAQAVISVEKVTK